MYKVLLLADSRGYAVKNYINTFLEDTPIPLHMEVLPYSGATVETVVTYGLFDARYMHYDQIYLLAGVNNLTNYHGRRQVSPRFYNWSEMVNRMMTEFHVARTRLYELSTHVVVCDLIGMHIGTYNEGKAYFPLQQSIIDDATIRVNEYIGEMNFEAWVYSP